jgi:hypothetical protein
MLAPFLDRMVARDIPSRFTVMEALQFFETILPESVTSLVFPKKQFHPVTNGTGGKAFQLTLSRKGKLVENHWPLTLLPF